MPRPVRVVSCYSKHRASGQAVVTLSGQDFYLGPHGTKASKLEYDRVISEWLGRGRGRLNADDITIVELILAYKEFAESDYRKNGEVTNEVKAILSAAKIVKQLYGRELASEFGPLKLNAVQQAMIRVGWTRMHINKQVGRVIRMFAWVVSKEMIRAHVAHALGEVPGLRQGRSEAKESP